MVFKEFFACFKVLAFIGSLFSSVVAATTSTHLTMQQVSKTELHIHLGGSWPISYLKSIADEEDIATLNSFLDKMEEKTEDMDYHTCFQAFSLASKIVNSVERVEKGTEVFCQEMSRDGVRYVEIRTGLKNLSAPAGKENIEGWEEYLLAVMNGIRKGCEGTDLVANILLSLKRNSSRELTQATLRLTKKYRGQFGVVGLDISDDALLGDGASILEIMPEVRDLQIPIALHLGECREETEAQQMYELESFSPARIGHGVFLSEAAREWIMQRRLPIEMCLTSAIRAHMVNSAEEHPGLELLRQGYPVCICTDDPLIFRTSHTQESELARSILGVSLDEIASNHREALKYKFG